jgi:catechol 2,3-dioxygenase-like lactoylglutathione lyase family enzyme
MLLKKLHHVAYRCRDAQETAEFYTDVLGLELAYAIIQDEVPSTQEHDPHIHIFFQMEDDSYIAFFDMTSTEDKIADADRDWAQHLALEVKDVETLLAAKARLVDAGIDVLGPTDHGICQSIYFYDPSGHRLEMAARTATVDMERQGRVEANDLLRAWNASKQGKAAAPAA